MNSLSGGASNLALLNYIKELENKNKDIEEKIQELEKHALGTYSNKAGAKHIFEVKIEDNRPFVVFCSHDGGANYAAFLCTNDASSIGVKQILYSDPNNFTMIHVQNINGSAQYQLTSKLTWFWLFAIGASPITHYVEES